VAKPDLGTKRLCAGCGAKFYDLNKTPMVCPMCETVFVPVVSAPRTRPEAKVAAVAPVVATVAVEPETADAEFVSLEDAEAEQQGGKKAAAAGEEEAAADDTIFIEEQEEVGSADVSDIIGEGVEKEEEQ
jgi:uncharacterized protein (TIGR02300 family)